MLLDLANLRDDGAGRFRKRFHYAMPEDDPVLLVYRDQLRKLWAAEPGADFALKIWVDRATSEPNQSWILRSFPGPRIGVVPNYSVFPLSLAIGATELASKMAVCANPECPNKYFLKKRKGQRFCDRLACAAYGQREHKRIWWREHGQEWKVKRENLRRNRYRTKPKQDFKNTKIASGGRDPDGSRSQLRGTPQSARRKHAKAT